MWREEVPSEEGVYACYYACELTFILIEKSVHSDGLCAMPLSGDPLTFRSNEVLWGPLVLSVEEYYKLSKLRIKLKRKLSDETEYEVVTSRKIASIKFIENIDILLGPKGVDIPFQYTLDDKFLLELCGDDSFYVDLRFSDGTYALDVPRDSFKILSKYGSGW